MGALAGAMVGGASRGNLGKFTPKSALAKERKVGTVVEIDEASKQKLSGDLSAKKIAGGTRVTFNFKDDSKINLDSYDGKVKVTHHWKDR